MKRSLRAIGLLLALLFLFPTLSASAGATRPLSPQNDAPTAWLSAREGSSLGKHDLRVVLVIPKATDPDEVTLSLTFEGENAPASLSKTLSELTLYRTLRAGGSVYSAADSRKAIAADRIAVKHVFMAEIPLIGYLKRVGFVELAWSSR